MGQLVGFNKNLTEEGALLASSQNPNVIYFPTDSNGIVFGGNRMDFGLSYLYAMLDSSMQSAHNRIEKLVEVYPVYVNRYSGFYKLGTPVEDGSNYVFVGVAIKDNDGYLVVGQPVSSTTWLNTTESGGGTTTTSLEEAFGDKDGDTNTSSQVTTYGNAITLSTALGYCHNYSKNDGTVGPGVGKWWLPSMGELNTILSKLNEIQMMYLTITLNAQSFVLPNNFVLCSSTEYNGSNVWCASNDGVFSYELKSSANFTVLPVTRLGH